MMHAKAAKMAPRTLAELVLEQLPQSDSVQSTEIAGPGFINIRLAKGAAFEPVIRCLTEHHQFGFHQATNERVQVEFVSANPTGPLHVGHGRGAVYGATLVNLLKARGHQVEAEYYVNDAGRQMNILAVSVFIRYLEHTGESVVFPSAGYQRRLYFQPRCDLVSKCWKLTPGFCRRAARWGTQLILKRPRTHTSTD